MTAFPEYPCQDYKELDSSQSIFDHLKDKPVADHFFQIKQDGIWCQLNVANGKIQYVSKTRQVKHETDYQPELVHTGPHILIGEYMFGSQRSQDPTVAGKFYCFDCTFTDGTDVSTAPYASRYRLAQSVIDRLADPRFEMVRCYKLGQYPEFLTLLQDKAEGFVFRSWRATYFSPLFKYKFEVEDDFVVTGMVGGLGKHAGRMGALELSQYDPATGKLTYVQNVGGGFSDGDREWWWHNFVLHAPNSMVVLVRGKGRFDGGALRHPDFIRLRTDKLPTDCILKRTSR